LGEYLIDEFEENGWKVFGFDREGLDITNTTKGREKIEEIQPEVVINAAALNDVDGIEENKQKFKRAQEVNGYAPGQLAEICADNNIKFIHYSTDFVFKGDKKEGYTEDDEPNPINKYGETKLLGEQQVKEKGHDYYIIRAARLFGEQGSSSNSKRSFVDTMIYLATEGKQDKLEIVDEQEGSLTYKKDLAQTTKEIVEKDYDPGVYHAANKGSCTWYEWAEKTFEYADIDVDYKAVTAEEFPRPAEIPDYSELKNTKLPEQRHWKKALKDYLS
jgi:dTDP-4-dehydrorhamnose reductase